MEYSIRQSVLDNPLFVAFRIRDSWAVWDDGGMEGEYGLWRSEWENRKAEERAKTAKLATEDAIHLLRMLQALQIASNCDETTTAFSVGCVVTLSSSGKVISTGYSREEPGNTHAEEVALNRLIRNFSKTDSSDVVELDLYTTMEPCSERLSQKAPCVQRVLDFNTLGLGREGRVMRIVRVFQGVKEPDDFVKCVGTQTLQRSHLEVATVTEPTLMKNSKTGEQLRVPSGWLEREAIRLAKKGHADQKESLGGEARLWSEQGWEPGPGDSNSSSSSSSSSSRGGESSASGLRRRGNDR
jgi:dolichyldiphosphatase